MIPALSFCAWWVCFFFTFFAGFFKTAEMAAKAFDKLSDRGCGHRLIKPCFWRPWMACSPQSPHRRHQRCDGRAGACHDLCALRYLMTVRFAKRRCVAYRVSITVSRLPLNGSWRGLRRPGYGSTPGCSAFAAGLLPRAALPHWRGGYRFRSGIRRCPP